MTNILTTLIKDTRFDYDALSSRFDIRCISYKSWSKDKRENELKYLPNRIYNSGPVLALVRYSTESQYWVICPKGETFILDDSSLAVRAASLSQIPQWIAMALLVRALPRVLSAPQTDQKRIEAEGLFYVVNTSSKARGREIIAVKVDIGWSATMRSRCLKLGATTFTPLEAHRKEDGGLFRKSANATRYQLDTLSQQITRSKGGDYIRKPFWKGGKNRVPAIKLNKCATLEEYYNSRLGVLSIFLEDLKLAYQGAFELQLESVEGVDHNRICVSSVTNSYAQISDWFAGRTIILVNHSNSAVAAEELKQRLEQKGITVQVVEDICESGLNLLLVEPKEQYEKTPGLDPYKQARQRYPNAVIQSCYPERLLGNGVAHVVEVLLKELLVKYEVNTGILQLPYPQLPDDAWFIHPVRPEDDKQKDWPMSYCRVESGQLEFGWLSDYWCEELEVGFNTAERKQVLEGKQRSDVIFWPKTGAFMIIADTSAVTLPNEALVHQHIKELDKTTNSSVPTNTVREYISQNTAEASAATKSLIESLSELCKLHPHAIPAKAFKAIKNQGKQNQYFYNWLAEQGHRLKVSWRSKDQGPLYITSGIWINRERGLYSIGSAGPAREDIENFSHIYHVNSTLPGAIPEWFWQSLQVWHVKHKNATVYPWVFKQLREFGEKCTPEPLAEQVLEELANG
jgi:hypothetical protein